jgi:diguanylate cyclase (GGDEF)-like protein/PAS domain S-box-containing protein
MAEIRPIVRRGLLLLPLTAVYFIAGKLGLSLAIVNPSASAVWPPAGIALAAFLFFGMRVWPAILVGALLVNLTTAGTWATSLIIAIGNTLEGVVGAYLVRRYASGIHAFERSYDVFKFVALAAFVSTILSATIGTTTLAITHFAAWNNYSAIWLTWWQGDAMGDILIAPPLLLWANQPRLHWTRRQMFEAPLLLLTVSLLALAGFCSWYAFPLVSDAMRVFCIPVIIWAAFRFGAREAATTSVLLSSLAIWGTLQGLGPFVDTQSPNDALLRLQLFIGVATAIGISVGVEVGERKRAARALIDLNDVLEKRVFERTASLTEVVQALRQQIAERNDAEIRFRRLVDSNIIGFMLVDMDGRILEANDAFLNELGYTREDLAQGMLRKQNLTPPGYHTMDEWMRTRLRESGYCPPFEKAYIRKDGSHWPVLVGVVRLDTPEPHVVCFVIDVTERRRAQDALQKSYDEMEHRVQERTNELIEANKALEKEITLRKRAEEELRNISLRDALTGLYNRRGFLAMADQQLLQALRDKREFLLFFVDVDGLKKINDSLGHARGDQALVQAGVVLQDTFRKSDIVARIGGDEFAVIASEAGAADQKIYETRLKEQLARCNTEGNFPFLVSLSMGSAIFQPKKLSTIQELMTLADQNLYASKRQPGHQAIRVIRAA